MHQAQPKNPDSFDHEFFEGLRWERCVGSGAHGHCWQATHEPTGQVLAIKTMATGPESAAELQALHAVHAFDESSATKHHIVHAFFSKIGVADAHNKAEFSNPAWTTIGMHFYAGGNLLELRNALLQVRDLPLLTAKSIMAQVIEAVAYCHQCNVAHGDLKAENVLLSGTIENLTATLADFSLAVDARTPQCVVSGTSFYRAPEVAAPIHAYDPVKADCWALGIMMCVVVQKQYCWDEALPMNLSFLKFSQTGVLDVDFAGDALLEDLVRRCLRLDPQKRPAIATLLSHPWFADVHPAAQSVAVVPRAPAFTAPVSGDEENEFDDSMGATLSPATVGLPPMGSPAQAQPLVTDDELAARAVAFALAVADDADDVAALPVHDEHAPAATSSFGFVDRKALMRRDHTFDEDDDSEQKMPRLTRRGEDAEEDFDEDGMAAAAAAARPSF